MTECVIYARVSTKEQQEEGFSIPAQLKGIHAFCAVEGLSPVAEFVEAESAGKAGRKQFGAMLEFLKANPAVQVVVAHKLDRLYRNFADQIALEETLGIRARYVVGDVPQTPQGELLRDVQLSVAKYYLSNLSEEVKKGMSEKASQGGWASGKAPVGYLNDKEGRRLVVDAEKAPLVVRAFERYATGLVSLSELAREVTNLGLKDGRRVGPSELHKLLKNPVYVGMVRYRGKLYEGIHEPIISGELFERVQAAFEPKRNGTKRRRHTFTLRGFMRCGVCGCLMTAERQKGHVYYRCTHSKGREVCDQRKYAREEKLLSEVEHVLAKIEITPAVVEALIQDAQILDERDNKAREAELAEIEGKIASLKKKSSTLLEHLVEGTIEPESYRAKATEYADALRGFELRRTRIAQGPSDTTRQVEALARKAAGARVFFTAGSLEERRELLSDVGLNLVVEGADIVSYQLKSPLGSLEMDSDGAFLKEWWAL